MEDISKLQNFYEDIKFPGKYTVDEITDVKDRWPYRHLVYGNVLDAGCGTGLFSHSFSMMEDVKSVTGLDFSRTSLNEARSFSKEHAILNTRFVEQDLNIYSPTTEYDFIYCGGVMHHLSGYRDVLSSLVKALKVGGSIVVGLYHPWGRIPMKIKQKLIGITDAFTCLDTRYLDNDNRRRAWLLDQYKCPFERCIGQSTITKMLKEENVHVDGFYPVDCSSNAMFNLSMLRHTYNGGFYLVHGTKCE